MRQLIGLGSESSPWSLEKLSKVDWAEAQDFLPYIWLESQWNVLIGIQDLGI